MEMTLTHGDALNRLIAAFLVAALAVTVAAAGANAGVLDQVRKRGHLLCGVSSGLVGFSTMADNGSWQGLDVEFCSALAAAVLGSRKAVKYVPVTVGERFTALRRGEIDVLGRATAWTLGRDSELGVRFTAVMFYDGQGFLVRKSEAITSALELSGATLCVLGDAQTEQAVADYFKPRRMPYELQRAERWDELVKSYVARNCTAFSADISALAIARARMDAPRTHSILPELISKEPMGPYVRQGDDQWFSIVRWTVMALIEAEELGVSETNAEAMLSSGTPAVRRLLGAEGSLGAALGLAKDWAYQAIHQVGNYGEIYDRNLGMRSLLRISRGLNALWSKGGLMYAAPFR